MNTCRVDFTPTEAAAMGRTLEPLARAEAKERQGRPDKLRSEKFTEQGKGDTRDKIGAAVGLSGGN